MPTQWKIRVVLGLTVLNAGWMLFDGTRALIAGDYVTPAQGECAGKPGPWSNLVNVIGIEPRSTLMKTIFAGYGLTASAMVTFIALQMSQARWGMVVVDLMGLWYIQFGTIANVIVLVSLIFLSR